MTRSAQVPSLRQGGAVRLPPARRPAGVSRRSLFAVLGFLVAAGLALVGQRWIAVGEYAADGVVLLVAGGVLLLVVLLSRSEPLTASLLTPDDDGQDGSLGQAQGPAPSGGAPGRGCGACCW